MLNSLATHPWAYPALEVVHLLGIALLLGNLVLIELRVWGLAVALPVDALAQLAFRVVLCGFGLAVASGLLMLASQWNDMLANRIFWWKMGLLTAAGFNAAYFHARNGLQRLDGFARFQTALSLGLWVLVVACGRFIAYA